MVGLEEGRSLVLNDLQRDIGAHANLSVLAQLDLGPCSEAGYGEGFVAWKVKDMLAHMIL